MINSKLFSSGIFNIACLIGPLDDQKYDAYITSPVYNPQFEQRLSKDPYLTKAKVFSIKGIEILSVYARRDRTSIFK